MIFRGEYWFLSNMYPCPVAINIAGKDYMFSCAEAAYQACKSDDAMYLKEMSHLDGFAAKRRGRLVEMTNETRKLWNESREVIMETVVRAKFAQNPALLQKLKLIEGDIIEENTWHDKFWGCCLEIKANSTTGESEEVLIGENKLGKLLMKIRDESI